MEYKVTGCKNCPLVSDSGYWCTCTHPAKVVKDIDRYVDEVEGTPDDCPLIKEPLTLSL